MPVSREPKHPLIDTNSSKRVFQTGKFSVLPQNLGTACLILQNFCGPTFTLSMNTLSLLASPTRTTPEAGKFKPVRTPSCCSKLGLDCYPPRARSLALRSSSWPCLSTNDFSTSIVSSCWLTCYLSTSLPDISPIQMCKRQHVEINRLYEE